MRNAIEEVKSNWVIILAIVSLIVTWTTFKADLTSAQDDIKDLKTLNNQLVDTNNQINLRLTKIETSVEYIKNSIEK